MRALHFYPDPFRILSVTTLRILNLDIFWLIDVSLDDVDSLPPPGGIAIEIVKNLQAALEAFQSVTEELGVEEGWCSVFEVNLLRTEGGANWGRTAG